MDIDNFYTKASFLEDHSCFYCFPHHMSACENGNICALRKKLRLSYFKSLISGSKNRPNRPAKSQIDWSLVIGYGECCSFCLVVITRNNDCHSGEHFHHADIFEYLVRRAIFAKSQAGMGRAYFYILGRVCNGLPNLVIYTSGGKIGKGRSKRDFSPDSHSCRDTHHIRFSNSALDISLRKFLYKLIQFK